MALVSRLLSGDPRLESCLVQDSAHLTPGTQGSFVAKAQKALIMLGEQPIATREYAAGFYGPSTAAAVLAYKRARQIVNYAYQTTADDVIGKMTIKRLDEDMAQLESLGPLRCRCGDPVLGSSAPNLRIAQSISAVAAPAEASRESYELPNVLWIAWHITTLGEQLGGRRHEEQVTACNALMKDVMIVPTGSSLQHVKAFEYPIRTASDTGDAFALRRAAGRAKSHVGHSALRVIVHGFTNGNPDYGFTTGGKFGDETFANFVVLNAERLRGDKLTLLHEMIHATNLALVHDSEPNNPNAFPDDKSVFSSNDNRDHIRPEHLQRLKAMPWCEPYPI